MILHEFVTRFDGDNEFDEIWDKVTIDLERIIAFNPSRTKNCTTLRTTSGEMFTVRDLYSDVCALMDVVERGTNINKWLIKSN